MSGISESARKAAPRHRASLLVRAADDARSHIAHLLELGELFSDRRLAQAPMQLQLVMPLPVLVDPYAAVPHHDCCRAEELLQLLAPMAGNTLTVCGSRVVSEERRDLAHELGVVARHDALSTRSRSTTAPIRLAGSPLGARRSVWPISAGDAPYCRRSEIKMAASAANASSAEFCLAASRKTSPSVPST